ncbi:TATA box-binding protein-associated factor RNA polymerase I subunit B-like [Penaeus chinensis]|uniref:TATA box-binding protein-associated factor RNA polymerase I subunit B-like n=1 Tax=Penaeus chinensis TaxID=139456 RepID=UPI001FB810E6|nr:TATA box-binding protein-associated factor RNA polymerase I subunit B-like [Penaeus chinensis]
MPNTCRTCGGSSFTVDCAVKMCDQCGTEQTNYAEYMSQEIFTEVDRSRYASQIADERDDADSVDSKPKEALQNDWTSYEAFNIVLFEWTQALRASGASKDFQEIVFRLWVTYLQRMEVAFMPLEGNKDFKPKASIMESMRDVQLIHSGQEQVVSTFSKRQRKTPNKEESLDRLKKKVENRKLRKMNENALSKYLALEMSKSIIDMAEESSDAESGIGVTNGSKRGIKRKNRSACSSIAEDDTLEGKTSAQSLASCSIAGDDVSEAKDSVDNFKTPVLCHNSFISKHVSKYRKEKDLQDEKTNGADKAHTAASKSFPMTKLYIQGSMPFHLNYKKLLGLLYLAVLLSEEEILLMDIIRWCREGHIPYVSAQNLLKEDMKMIREDMGVFRKMVVPTADAIQEVAGKMAAFLSIQYIPLPREDMIIERIVESLRLPEAVSSMAKDLVHHSRCKIDYTFCLRVPDLEAIAMASVISVVKLCCGLDGSQEVRLSQAAKIMNEHHKDKPAWTHLFSWEEWERHMSSLVWFCSQVDAVFAHHFKSFGTGGVNAKILSQFYWEEGIWRTPKTITNYGHNEAAYKIIEKFLDFQGKPLEDMVDQNTVLRMSRSPFMDIVSNFLVKFKDDKDKSIQQLVKIGRRLQRKSFKTQKINWAADLKNVQAKLAKCGSNLTLQPQTLLDHKDNHNKNNKSSNSKIHSKSNIDLENPILDESEQKLLIPQPHRNIWRANWTHKNRVEAWNSCPATYKWIINLGSLMIETHRNRLLYYIEIFEKLR